MSKITISLDPKVPEEREEIIRSLHHKIPNIHNEIDDIISVQIQKEKDDFIPISNLKLYLKSLLE